MGAFTNPAFAQLGAQVFGTEGYSYQAGGNVYTGESAGSTLIVNGALGVPLTKPQFREEIYPINWAIGPLLGLLQNEPMTKHTLREYTNVFTWTTDRDMPEVTEATGTVLVGGTIIGVAFVDMFMATDTAWIPDAGDAYGIVNTVTGSGGAGTIAVTWITAPSVGITPDMAVYKIGNTQAEFSVPVPHPNTAKVQSYNYFQEMRYARQESERFGKQGWQIGAPGGNIPAYEKQKLLRGAQLEWEKTQWFGQRSWNATNGVGTLNGVYYAPGARRWNAAGAVLTAPLWEIFIDRGRRHRWERPGKTYTMMGTAQYAQIGTFADTAVRTQPGKKLPFGITVHTWVAKDGKDDIELIVNPLFDAMHRDDLIVQLRMEPGAVALVDCPYHPNIVYEEHIVPLGASWIQYGYRVNSSQMIIDGFGHVNIYYGLGSSTTDLV